MTCQRLLIVEMDNDDRLRCQAKKINLRDLFDKLITLCFNSNSLNYMALLSVLELSIVLLRGKGQYFKCKYFEKFKKLESHKRPSWRHHERREPIDWRRRGHYERYVSYIFFEFFFLKYWQIQERNAKNCSVIWSRSFFLLVKKGKWSQTPDYHVCR